MNIHIQPQHHTLCYSINCHQFFTSLWTNIASLKSVQANFSHHHSLCMSFIWVFILILYKNRFWIIWRITYPSTDNFFHRIMNFLTAIILLALKVFQGIRKYVWSHWHYLVIQCPTFSRSSADIASNGLMAKERFPPGMNESDHILIYSSVGHITSWLSIFRSL